MRGFLVFILVVIGQLSAQHKCRTMEETAKVLAQDEFYALGRNEMLQLAEQFQLGELGNESRDSKEFIIPVVIHVLYTQESDNISMDQINSQIDVLNRDYHLLNNDVNKTPAAFRALAGNPNIKFVLADKDPDGNFTTGVTRTQVSIEEIGGTEKYYKTSEGGVDPWPQPFYMNVWVCRIGGLTLGYSILPSASMSERDGIVMDPRAFGTSGTAKAPYDGGRTMVHEVGHYLGLLHPWGDEEGSCSNTDYMSDTPNQFDANNGCQVFPKFSCGGTDNGDMFMNYMDYATDSCMFLFTQQQANFMRLILKRTRVSLAYSDAVTTVEEAQGSNSLFLVYPNPARDQLHVEVSEPELVEVIGVAGQLNRQIELNAGVNYIDLTDYPSGIYYLKSESDIHKLIIQ